MKNRITIVKWNFLMRRIKWGKKQFLSTEKAVFINSLIKSYGIIFYERGEDMEHKQLREVISYIEEHLKDDRRGILDNETLARVAGYSEYYFIRLFSSYVKCTPADYIRKRRISEIVRLIASDSRPISDIAFEYGFNSKENFTRAFKSEHNILPTEFKRANCSLRLYEKYDFGNKEYHPEVYLRYIQAFSLVMYPFGNEYPPKAWNRYNADRCSGKLSGGKDVEDYGAMIWNSEKGKLDYYIGIAESEALGDISGTVKISFTDGLYAVFETVPSTQYDFVEIIRNTWKYIYSTWLPANGFKRGEGYEFESYLESGKKYSERIYIPIKTTKGEENG